MAVGDPIPPFRIDARGLDAVAVFRQIDATRAEVSTLRCGFCALPITETVGARYKERPKTYCSARCRGWAWSAKNGTLGLSAQHVAKMAEEIRRLASGRR